MALGYCVVLVVVIGACALWKRVNMAKQAARWRDKQLLMGKYVVEVLRQPLAGWYENATFLKLVGTSITRIDEVQHEYEQAMETAVFGSTKQLLHGQINQIGVYRGRIMYRLQAIAQMEPLLLEMLDERGHAEWAEGLFRNGVRRFGDLAGFEAGDLMNRLPGLTLGAASELILESSDGRVAREVPVARGVPVEFGNIIDVTN